MKTSMTLQELATEIDRQQKAKADYTGNTERMTMTAEHEDGSVRFALDRIGLFSITGHAHRQVGEHVHIPAKYYDRMLSLAPELLTENVNHWLSSQPSHRLVRTLDGSMRAFLSDSYRALDNAELVQAILPAISKSGAEVHSAHISDTKLFIKAVVPDRVVVVPPPADRSGPGYRNEVAVQPGITITNSEVGAGAITIQPAVHQLSCTNMAIWAGEALRRRHLGSRILSDSERIQQYFSDRTNELADQHLWSQLRDVADSAMSGKMFDDILEHLRAARENTFPAAHTTAIVERVAQSKGLTENEQNSVLAHLIEGGELSQFAVQAAVTRASQDSEDYHRATELEVIGGDIIALPPRDWNAIVAV